MGSRAVEAQKHYRRQNINYALLDNTYMEIKMQMPVIRAVDFTPTELIPFNTAVASLKREPLKGTVHFFLNEEQIERIWSNLEKYTEKLRAFEAVCTPDYSMYLDYPNAICFYNTYRNRLVGQWWQEAGHIVIPTVSWVDKRTYPYAFSGLEPGGTYAVSSNGWWENDRHSRNVRRKLFEDGIQEMCQRLSPKRIIVHGTREAPDINYGNAEVVFCPSKISIEKNIRQHPKLYAKEEVKINV